MPTDTPETCSHISQLKPKPSAEDLARLRKGLRKRKVPTFELDRGEHSRVGRFVLTDRNGETSIEWSLPGGDTRVVSLSNLNLKSAHELDRLEVGWLIADMYQLDCMHQCVDLADPRETMKTMAWFGRREDEYRHWALVPAGHMKFDT